MTDAPAAPDAPDAPDLTEELATALAVQQPVLLDTLNGLYDDAMAWPRDWIYDYLKRHEEDPHRTTYLGFLDDRPIGYLEVYDPFHDVLGQHAPLLPGDIGAHVLIGDEDQLGRSSVAFGFAVNRYLFAKPGVHRIVGEPDVRHHNFLSLLAFLGYRKHQELELPDKTAAFMVCERRDFERLSSRRRRR